MQPYTAVGCSPGHPRPGAEVGGRGWPSPSQSKGCRKAAVGWKAPQGGTEGREQVLGFVFNELLRCYASRDAAGVRC